MAQYTTAEFAYRLEVALEGHPHAPATPHGRQSWLRRTLRDQTGRDVSPNTVHKWCRGTARPRADAMRDLARVLNVDEVWLSMGVKPSAATTVSDENVAAARAATLLVAGLIESAGGRVTFPAPDDSVVSLYANVGDSSLGIVAVAPQSPGDNPVFIVPEPAEDNVVVGVVMQSPANGYAGTALIELLDLTDAPRENLGGFSLARLEGRKNHAYKVDGRRGLIRPLSHVSELGEASE